MMGWQWKLWFFYSFSSSLNLMHTIELDSGLLTLQRVIEMVNLLVKYHKNAYVQTCFDSVQ